MNKPTPVQPRVSTALQPADISSVRLEGGFWGDVQQVNRTATLPHEVAWLEKFGTLANFDAVVEGTIAKKRVGREFADSDVYKVLEALAWENGREPSPGLQETADQLVARVLPVLEEDGYISTRYGHPGQEARYSNMEWGHELYCYGHLIQAGVAALRTGQAPSDPLPRLAIAVANHVCDVFGPNGLQLIDGHPEIEVALAELYRATGDTRYLEQAKLFIDRRGHKTLADIEFGRSYFQDEVPVRDTEILHGHSVRALYLAAAAIDVAIETEDIELLKLVEKQYQATLDRRTYITGGMGSHHQDEAFGDDYELPSDRAYAETCAGVASIMVAWRLLLATGNLSYGDIIERTLYNIVATSRSEEGTTFFYSNPLHQRVENHPVDPDTWIPRASSAQRAAWFEVSCCPPNVSRTLAQLGSYVATHNAEGVQIIQYANADIQSTLDSENSVRLRMRTDYPWDGKVCVEVLEAPARPWDLTFRIPAWADNATVTVGTDIRPADSPSLTLTSLKAGDTVTLDIPLLPRFTFPDPRIDAVRGCVAVERGPLVMCAESVDQEGGADVSRLAIDVNASLHNSGRQVIAHGAIADFPDQTQPYSPSMPKIASRSARIVLSPYFAWANRGPTTMRVWLPTA